MRRLQKLAISLAALAVLVALGVLFFGEAPLPEPVFPLADIEDEAATGDDRGADGRHEGGVYGGIVRTAEGNPLHGARVLLVAYAGGSPRMLTQGAGADPDPDVIADVPIVGRYKIGGEAITDSEGRFRIAADAQSLITRVLAYHKGYFLSVVEVTKPREDLVLTLKLAGRVVGQVVDDATGAPVPRAVVDVYLQQKVSKIPEGTGTYGAFKRKQHEMSWLVTLGRFIGETLGPRIWNVLDSKSDSLRLYTDDNGMFELGPLGNSVQIEFVITHPSYKWIDFDTNEGKQTPARLVVEPGTTVEREFRMRKGLHVSGQVVDDEGNPVPDVFVKVQSISAYYRHWWYRHKWRHARTDAQGRFRVEGLAIGSQQVIFQHPSFKEITESVEAGTDEFLVVVERFGALHGTLEGISRSRHRRRIRVFFEAVGDGLKVQRMTQRHAPLEVDNSFLIERVTPGTYRVWVKAGKESSQPVQMEIKALVVENQSFEIGSGGTLLARVVDDRGSLIDPASARLVSLSEDKERAMGSFVTREGEFEIEGISPGRYLLRLSAAGRVPKDSEPFEVGPDRVANLGAVTLERYGYVQFAAPLNERGRPAKLTGDLIIEYRRTSKDPWKRFYSTKFGQLHLAPGPFQYRARSGEMSDEGTLEVVGGETKNAPIQFPGDG